MKNKPRIFAFHLLNDFSGSPKVLKQLIQCWTNEAYEVHLYTSLHQVGFLTSLKNVTYHAGWYRFAKNPILRLINYLLSQVILLATLFFKIKKTDIIYVNTVLPFGAAILGKLKGCKVYYHIHESTVNPKVLKWFLFKIIKLTAYNIINVSNFVAKSHQISSIQNHLLYNAIDDEFVEKAQFTQKKSKTNSVLMVCSLKTYKGVFEYLKLAESLPQFQFKLVLNASQTEIDLFFNNSKIPANLMIFSSQKNLHSFYSNADVIVNLSRPDAWIETFGLTIIEGMVYGLPAIVPPIGGITEVVTEGLNGSLVDCREHEKLKTTLCKILENDEYYMHLSHHSKEAINHFKQENFFEKSLAILEPRKG
jgi:glycosyltransferase involved in cell wall biosynthesis